MILEQGFSIIIGGQRCGSTYLLNLLLKSAKFVPSLSLRPEPKWFLNTQNTEKNVSEYINEVFGINLEINKTELKKTYLEKSTSYFVNQHVIPRISSLIPDVKIVLILRNPVERLISHWRFSTANKLETLSLNQVLELPFDSREFKNHKISSNPFNYVSDSIYINHIEPWISRFHQVKIVFLEELSSNVEILQDLFEYLEAPIDDINMNQIWPGVVVNSTSGPKVSSETISRLEKFFRPYNLELSDLLNRKLPF